MAAVEGYPVAIVAWPSRLGRRTLGIPDKTKGRLMTAGKYAVKPASKVFCREEHGTRFRRSSGRRSTRESPKKNRYDIKCNRPVLGLRSSREWTCKAKCRRGAESSDVIAAPDWGPATVLNPTDSEVLRSAKCSFYSVVDMPSALPGPGLFCKVLEAWRGREKGKSRNDSSEPS